MDAKLALGNLFCASANFLLEICLRSPRRAHEQRKKDCLRLIS